METLRKLVPKLAEQLIDGFFKSKEIISSSYVMFFGVKEKVKTLERKIKLLTSREADVENELKAAIEFQPGRKRKREVVDNWLKGVKKAKIEFESLQGEVGESKFYSLSRVRLGMRVERLIEEVVELHQEDNFSEGFSFDVHETRGLALPTASVVGQTFKRNCEEVLRCLMNDEVLSMGIYGMGGVGKTTVLKHVHNQILQDRDTFGSIYWVTVSQNFSIDRLQTDISRKVGLDLSSEDDEMTRAACLFETLKRKGKYILILDDVWGNIPLERVGIPVGVNQCKLILTTRLLDVCNRMVCREKLKISPLSEEEAWHLFMEKLGPDGELTSQVIEIAKRVAKRCAGLPMGIITMAASMRGVSNIHGWRNALEEVKNPTMGLSSGIESEVLPVLEYSYNHLGGKKLQLCFLHCATYPEDYEFPSDELIDYFIVEGLMDRSKSRQAEIDMGHTVLNKLKNCCLLENSTIFENNIVKMHDLIRDMALQIMRASKKVMMKAGLQLREIPEEVEWTEDLEKVSLMVNEITEIPAGRSPRCPSLSTLMLQNNHLRQIPNSFFVHLHGLRVLNLCHNSDLLELPNSIGDLGNLNALLLRGCKKLKRIPSLGKLRELTDLDLGQTGLTELPQGMEELFHLKCLCMDGTEIVGMIRSGILPRLSHLQSFITWSGDRTVGLGVGVRAKEVMELKQLEVFQSRVSNLCDYNLFVASKWFERLWKCRLRVTSQEELDDYEKFRYYNRYYNTESNKSVVLDKCNLRRGGQGSWEDGVLLPRDIQSLEIVECSDTGSCLFDVFHSWNDATELKKIFIFGCKEVEWVVKLLPSSSSSSECIQLPSLETLHLEGMENKGIFKWELGVISPIPPTCGNESFFGLKQLHIYECNKMKVGLTVNCLLHLPILEVLDLEYCEQMEEIIGGGEEEEEEEGEEDNHSRSSTNIAITIPKLRVLHLWNLPELKSICRGKMICDSIQEILLDSCKKLKRLGIGSSWSGGDTDGQETASPFPALEGLDIRHCEQMEEIIGGGDEEGEEEDNHSRSSTNIAITLPKLRKLVVGGLPELKSIYRGKMICDSIEGIILYSCQKLKRLGIGSSWSGGDTDGQETASPFPALQQIRINKEWWESVELEVDKTLLQPFVRYS